MLHGLLRIKYLIWWKWWVGKFWKGVNMTCLKKKITISLVRLRKMSKVPLKPNDVNEKRITAATNYEHLKLPTRKAAAEFWTLLCKYCPSRASQLVTVCVQVSWDVNQTPFVKMRSTRLLSFRVFQYHVHYTRYMPRQSNPPWFDHPYLFLHLPRKIIFVDVLVSHDHLKTVSNKWFKHLTNQKLFYKA